MGQPAADSIRPTPRYGWLAAVIPASATRFRVDDVELAATLASAGAEFVAAAPEVEVATPGRLKGDAACAVVALRATAPESSSRMLRGVRRLAGAALLRSRATYARKLMSRAGYTSTYSLAWDRGTPVRANGSPHGSSRLAHRFPLNQVVVGRRDAEETAFAAARAAAGRALGRPFDEESLLLAASGVIVARGADAVLRVGIGPSSARIADQLRALASLAAGEPPPEVADRIPWPIAHGSTGLATWSLEHRLPGRRATSSPNRALTKACIDFLVRLHAVSAPGEVRAIADDAEIVAAIASPEAAASVRELGRRLDDRLGDVPRGFAHGDFWTGNLLVDGGELTGVVDWPSAGPRMLPLLDLLHLKAVALQEATARNIGAVVLDELVPEMRAGGGDDVRAYCQQVGLDAREDLLLDLVKTYWLAAVAHDLVDRDRDPHASRRPRWRELNVERVVRAFAAGDARPTGAHVDREPVNER